MELMLGHGKYMHVVPICYCLLNVTGTCGFD